MTCSSFLFLTWMSCRSGADGHGSPPAVCLHEKPFRRGSAWPRETGTCASPALLSPCHRGLSRGPGCRLELLQGKAGKERKERHRQRRKVSRLLPFHAEASPGGSPSYLAPQETPDLWEVNVVAAAAARGARLSREAREGESEPSPARPAESAARSVSWGLRPAPRRASKDSEAPQPSSSSSSSSRRGRQARRPRSPAPLAQSALSLRSIQGCSQ